MTALFILLGRFGLAAVFAVASLSKLASISLTRESVIQFGVPARLATPFTVALILCEAMVGVALIPAPTARYAAIAAAALFLLFSIAIGANLLRGNRPACNCFGQLHPTEIGWPTFARNLALAGVATFVAADARDAQLSLFTWTVAAALALLLLLANVALLVQVLRQQGRMLLRFEAIERHLGVTSQEPPQPSGLVPGSPAPRFELPLLDGEQLRLEQLLEKKNPALLVFSNPGCGPCLALVPQIAQWQRELGDDLAIALISSGSPEENRAKFAGVQNVLLQEETAIAEAYQSYATPSAVVVAPDGRIASFLAQGSDAIGQLVSALRGGALQAAMISPGISPGNDVPEIALRTLDDEAFALASLRGTSVLLVFWNQDCGFCQQMLPELRAWEAAAGANAPRLLLVSSNTAEAHAGIGLDATILLDRNGRAAQAFGARGTPMGILIDVRGRIASHLAAGATEIFALAPHTSRSTSNGSLV